MYWASCLPLFFSTFQVELVLLTVNCRTYVGNCMTYWMGFQLESFYCIRYYLVTINDHYFNHGPWTLLHMKICHYCASLSLSQGAFIHCGTAVEYLHHMCHSSFMKEASLFSHEAEVKYVGAPPLHQGESLLLGVTANSINSHYVLPLYNIWIKSIEVIE